MNTDDTPTTPDAERFAAAVEAGVAEGAVDPAADPDLARELEIVDLLTRHGAAFDPEPDARARARQRLAAALEAARDVDARGDGPSRAS